MARPWRGHFGPPGGVRGGKLLRGYTFHVYLSTGLTRRSLQRGGFNGYAVIPPTPGDPLRTPLATPWGSLGTPWGPLRDPLGTLWDRWGSLGEPLVPQESPKSAPRAPQERLRALKSAPRESNERPKRARKRSEGAPRGLPRRREELLEDPKGCQGVPRSTKIDFQRASHGQPLTAYDFQSHETEFC